MVHVFHLVPRLVLVINFWCNFLGVTFLRMDINSALNSSSFPTEHEEDLEIRADEISSEPIQCGAAVRSEGTIEDTMESRQSSIMLDHAIEHAAVDS